METDYKVGNTTNSFSLTSTTKLKDLEKWAILEVYKYNGYKKRRTAKILGISYVTLLRKLRKYGVK